jgi:hypothetical protein
MAELKVCWDPMQGEGAVPVGGCIFLYSQE